MSLGMIREIRSRHPEVQFDILCAGPLIKNLLQPENLFDNYFFFRRPRKLGETWSVLRLLGRLCRHYNDCIVGWRMDPKKGRLLAAWTGASRRIGNWRGMPVDTYTQQIEYTLDIHENDANLQMARFLFDDLVPEAVPVLIPTATEQSRAIQLRSDFGAASGPLLAMHPGSDAKGKVKRWPVERYAEVAQRFNAHHQDAHVWVFLGPDESDLAPGFAGLERVRVVQEKGIRIVLALIAQCDAMLNSDSGLGHMAASVGIPTVCIMGPENEKSCRPYGGHVRVLTVPGLECRPCVSRAVALACPHRNCIMQMPTNRVLADLESLFPPNAPPAKLPPKQTPRMV